MIEQISLKDTACFDANEAQKVNFNQRVAIFYGLNGTGKSTIARYIKEPEKSEYQHCSITFKASSSSELFVYNKDFIDRNFYDNDNINGIFTIGEIDITSEKIIENSNKRIRSIRNEILRKESKLIDIDEELNESENDVLDESWKIMIPFRGGTLDYCLEGFRAEKAKYFHHLKTIELVEEPEFIFDDLIKAVEEVEGEDIQPIDIPSKILQDFKVIEDDDVFTQKILASSSSYLSEVIQKLDNTNWIASGKLILESEDYQQLEDICPFCQQDLPDNFISELESLFDITYKEKEAHLEKIYDNYKNLKESLEEQLSKTEYQSNYLTENAEFQKLKGDILRQLQTNLALIGEKKNNLSEIVSIYDTLSLIDEANEIIESVEEQIILFNERLSSPDTIKSEVKTKFWSLLRNKTNLIITSFDILVKIDEEKKAKLKEYIKKGGRVIDNLNDHIRIRKETITNISQSVEWINERAKSLGMIGFEIIETDDDSNTYQLVRNEDSENVFASLSEGEKALITFLYFLKLIEGASGSEDAVNLGNRIIVIDDPVSSLSHNYVYEIASQIEFGVIRKDYGQVLVLTHNLFFLHELLHIKKNKYEKDYDLFRLVKHEKTQVKRLEEKDIQNDYQGYWQTLKDIKESQNYLLAPIVMRNILENFFSFIKKRESLSESVLELEEEYREYKPFLRYINKEAHSDINTLQDMGEIDPERFFQIFKIIFRKAGYEDHYYTMSGENPNEE